MLNTITIASETVTPFLSDSGDIRSIAGECLKKVLSESPSLGKTIEPQLIKLIDQKSPSINLEQVMYLLELTNTPNAKILVNNYRLREQKRKEEQRKKEEEQRKEREREERERIANLPTVTLRSYQGNAVLIWNRVGGGASNGRVINSFKSTKRNVKVYDTEYYTIPGTSRTYKWYNVTVGCQKGWVMDTYVSNF